MERDRKTAATMGTRDLRFRTLDDAAAKRTTPMRRGRRQRGARGRIPTMPPSTRMRR
jgi:hypothetical protein